MKSLSLGGPEGAASLVDVPIPMAGPDQALIKIEASAICGSELGSDPGSNPGHEAAGVVASAPAGSGFEAGERVGVSAVTGCGDCDHCRAGVELYCDRWQIHIGMHAEYVAVPVPALRRIPPGTSPQHAVLISGDTLGVPARAASRVPSAPGDRVLVIGLGPVGLGHTLVRARTGAEVIAVEPSAYRRELALRLGATAVHTPGDDLGPRPGLVIECTGRPDCVAQALELVAPGGTVLQSGECESVELSPSETVIRREITYTGTWYCASADFPEMLRLYESGLPVDLIMTHEFPADQIAAAYRTFLAKESGKVVLRWT